MRTKCWPADFLYPIVGPAVVGAYVPPAVPVTPADASATVAGAVEAATSPTEWIVGLTVVVAVGVAAAVVVGLASARRGWARASSRASSRASDSGRSDSGPAIAVEDRSPI